MQLCNRNEIRELLERHGFRFSKSMGQNFLTASWVPERIADEAGLNEKTGVLEIGPGIGCLTIELARRAGKVLSVELDRALKPLLSETHDGLDNVEVLFGDILKQDISALVTEKLAGMRPVVCANLPYNITSPLLTSLIDAKRFDTITVMVQREVARRLCAGAGTSDYSSFTIYVNWHAEPEILFDVSPGCFMPQPKVTSSVVRLNIRKTPPVQVKDEKFFFRLVRAAFALRRKTLVNALTAGLNGHTKPEIEAALSACGHNPKVRGEVLDIAQFAALSDKLHRE